MKAIRWVRDPRRCDIYYICQYGQPLPMPACPHGQVWSNAALNCVPENSRWNDCSISLHHQILKKTGKYSESYWGSGSTKISLVLPERNEIILKNSENIKIPRDKSFLVADKDFWENLLIAVEKLLTTEKSTVQSNTLTPHNDHNDDDAMDKNFWHTIFTTTAPLHLKQSYEQKLVLSNTRTLEDSESTRHRENPQSQSSPHHKEESKSKISRSPWFSLVEKNKSDYKDDTFNIPKDNPCAGLTKGLLPHPRNCHWYFNCSSSSSIVNPDSLLASQTSYLKNHLTNTGGDQDSTLALNRYYGTELWNIEEEDDFIRMDPTPVRGVELFVWECRYPQLFDHVSGHCREFMNVDCRARFEPYDQCEYSVRQCPKGSPSCVPCENRFGQCRGRENGVYPLQGSHTWSPVFVTCYLQRNIARDECRPPKPVFSPYKLDCVSLLEVPKQHGGFQPDCTARPDGYYPDEQGRCAIFFRCALGHFRGYDECPPGSVFDPAQLACETYSEASQPCGMGQAPRCAERMDGLFADPHGRCTHYFQCKAGEFQQYHTCDLGIFDPLTHRCVVSAELTMRPCGVQPSPCEALPTGMYPDQATDCRYFIECYKGVLLTNGTCPLGTVFSALTGRCDTPEQAPPPCGTSHVCLGRRDGRYPATIRGCSFYFECQHGQFTSLRRCTAEEGGYFFNPETGHCDYPENICPPCGYRWWGW
ncbi:chitin binding beak protein 1 [Elysia marginata]|uniref:Chitin binding beak protein 1 n=1 Tax=Elysia marginata TaxID=1093978 RepID=A0AAV4I7L3_9GAST|nr:chitin binding beak protein 1 [Elysia marginata]